MVDKEIKKGIVSSLIATLIFLILLNPILHMLWNFIKSFSINMYSGISDSIYSGAALGQRNWLDFAWLASVVAITGGIVVTKNVIIWKEIFRLRRLMQGEKEEPETPLSLYQTLKKANITLSVAIALGIVVSFFFIFSAFTDLQLNTSFNQRLNAILSYISDQEAKVYKSSWATMKNRQDFEKINQKMEMVAGFNKIKLPENLLK